MSTERPIKSLSELMDGSVEERFNEELAKVWQNVYDPMTDPTKVREVILKVKIAPNERRDACSFRVSVSSKLAPHNELSQTVMLQYNTNGTVTATERTDQVPGQIDMQGNEQPMPHVLTFRANSDNAKEA